MKLYIYIYNDYYNKFYRYAEEKYSWYKKNDNLKDAVKKAFLSEDEQGKVDSHQHLVGRKRLALAAEIALEKFDYCNISFENFQSIYQFVESVSYEVKGFGQLATYDVALRIAKYLGLELLEVYLHAGVTVGTRALGFQKVKDGDIISIEKFPAPFNQLSGDHLENLLCIYKEVLANSSVEVRKTCIRPKTNSSCISK